MINDKSFGVVPIQKKNNEIKFLIVKHKDGHWGFPKGHLKSRENELDCANRELIEETGATNIHLNPKIKFEENYTCEQDGKEYNKTVTYFFFFFYDFCKNIKDSEEEITQVLLLNYQNARNILTHNIAKEILDKAYNIVKNEK